MAPKAKGKDFTQEDAIVKVERGHISVFVLGTTPLILNRMSDKAKHQLLLPQRLTAADKESRLKHDPIAEFKDAAHTIKDNKAKTFLALQSTAFKKSLSNAALDMPGAKKSQIGRLTYVEGNFIEIYGEPQLFMSVVRSADIAKTPDIRTRVILPKWAAKLNITFVRPLLRERPVLELLMASGLYIGVGDWRPEKGSGTFGMFEVVNKGTSEFREFEKVCRFGRAQQIRAMADPVCFDDETSELLGWYKSEVVRRGFDAKTGRRIDKKPRVAAAAFRPNGKERGVPGPVLRRSQTTDRELPVS